MKLEDQVVSLELAKRMKELGFEQESLFYWIYELYDKGKWTLILADDYVTTNPIIPAHTVPELGEILIPFLQKDREAIDYMGELKALYEQINTMQNEADNRAKLAIYLKTTIY